MNESYEGQELEGEGQAIISLDGVSFGYDPEHPILQNITLSISQGQWVSLVGPNGCGKSTLVKLLNALLPKSAGEIVVSGMQLSEERSEAFGNASVWCSKIQIISLLEPL